MIRSFPRILVASVVSALCAFAVSAASAQVPSTAPARDGWSGFYLGINAGYGRSGNQTFNQTDRFEYSQAFGPAFFKPVSIQGRDSGALGGLQIGYNWEAASRWLIGVEADWSWTRLKLGGTFGPLIEFDGAVAGNSHSTFQTDIRRLGSARGRLGFTQPNWMAYVTGGLAIAQTKFKSDLVCAPGVCTGDDEGYSHAPASFTRTELGWVLGGGAEFKVSGSPWILGLEYLHYDFSTPHSADAALIRMSNGATFGVASCKAGELCTHYSFSGFSIDAVRARLSYKFD